MSRESSQVSELEDTFDQTLAAGYRRLSRPWNSQLVTALMAGIEVGPGVLALLYTLHVTDSHLLAGLAFSIGFVIASTQLFHSVLDSLLIFAALQTGQASFSYLDWLIQFGWSALGNMVGGIGLVTALRLVQTHRRVQHHGQQADPTT